MTYDCAVLGAGMVGISTALHLQRKGRSVVLVDRKPPADETSYGNAGIIQTEGVMAYTFPRDVRKILAYAFNRSHEARLRYGALPEIAPWLWQYWRHGSVELAMASARGLAPLIDRCLAEHEALIADAGAEDLLHRTGYLKVYRNADDLEAAEREQAFVRDTFGVPYAAVDQAGLSELEPNIAAAAGAIHLTGPATVRDPGTLGKRYAARFEDQDGVRLQQAVASLKRTGSSWRVALDGPGPDHIEARDVIVALGPWSAKFLDGHARNIPLLAKRGYHMHYAPQGNARLNRPVLDTDNGYVLAPMSNGIRLTTGAEFARRDAAPNPSQLDAVEPIAQQFFPLGARLEESVWMGRRPCLPDMLPMVGPVPGQPHLWANFGHQHLGFTLGPVTGRLLSELVTGEDPFTDPAPYRIDRF